MSPKLLNILLLLTSVVMYYFVITPLQDGLGTLWTPPEGGITQLREKKAEYQETINQVASILKQADDLNTDYTSVTDEEKAKLKMMVPDSIDKVRLLSEITNIGNQSGITLNDLVVNELKSSDDKNVGTYTVTFTVKSTYPRFKEIIRNFDTSLRLFSTDSIAFTAQEKETDPLSFNVRILTYFIK